MLSVTSEITPVTPKVTAPEIKLRCICIKPLNFADRKVDRFEVVEAPEYVRFHVFDKSETLKDWETLRDLLSGGHSVTIETTVQRVPLTEYQAGGMNE